MPAALGSKMETYIRMSVRMIMMMLEAQAITLKRQGVGEFAHQVAAVDQQKNENQHDGQPDAVAHLRIDQDFPERRLRNQNDSRADHDQQRVQRVERRALP